MAKVKVKKSASKKDVGGEAVADTTVEFPSLAAELQYGWDERGDVEDDHRELGVRLYRASMVGECHSALVAYALEETPGELPEKILRRANESKRLERELLDRACTDMNARSVTFPEIVQLKDKGIIAGFNHDTEFGGDGQVQVRMWLSKKKEALLFGHLDRMLHFESSGIELPAEAKAVGSDMWKMYLKSPMNFLEKAADGKYAWQVSAIMAMTGTPLVLIVGLKEGDDEDAKLAEVQWTLIEEPPYSKKEVKARLKDADYDAAKGNIPACEEGRFGCPYYTFPFHGKDAEKAKREQIEWIEGDTYAQLAEWVFKRETARIDKKHAEEEYDEAKANIDALLTELELDRTKRYGVVHAGNRLTVRWVERPMPERVLKAGVQVFPEVKLIGSEGEST